MSRAQTRARRRAARLVELRAELASVRDRPEELWAMFARVAGSRMRAWPLAGLTPEDRPLSDDELAMLLEAVRRAMG